MINADTIKWLADIACEIRKDIIRMHRKGTSVGSAMSIVDILTVLYFDVLHLPSPADSSRDRFILSKGHAVSALYSVLARKNFIDYQILNTYLEDGSPLLGHPSHGSLLGIEVSTGSLGHGLPIAAGMAIAAKHSHSPHRIFVLMGDGELQEGSVWESSISVARLNLDNLVVIVDANGLQGYGQTAKIIPTDSLSAKWSAFGWIAKEVNGHDINELSMVLNSVPFHPGKPSVIIAHTIKGKGVKEMENQLGWHYFSVPSEKEAVFLNELGSKE